MSQRTPGVTVATLAEAEAEAESAASVRANISASTIVTTPATITETATATTTPAAGYGAEDWTSLNYLNEGMFGSVDSRTRSTSGSTVWRSGTTGPGNSELLSSASTFPVDQDAGMRGHGMYMHGVLDEGIVRLENCTESSEPDKVNDCLSEMTTYLDQYANDPTKMAAAAGIAGWYPDAALRLLSHHMPRLLSHYKWYIRARAYKLLRRLPSPRALEYCSRYMELCVIHTLSRDDSAHEEREQGLKYIRWTMRFDEELWLLGPHVLKALMSVAEQVDDRMRNICLETLSEVLVIAPERLQYANGIRTLGLVEALVSVALDSQQPDIADASSTLLKWLAQHPHMPLPEKHVTRFQTLPKLISSALAESSTRSLGAKRVICKIEGIPSLSMGQLPSQRMDSWASSLASSVFYRQHLRQCQLQKALASQDSVRTRNGNHIARLDQIDGFGIQDVSTAAAGMLGSNGSTAKGFGAHGSFSTVGTSKGLAAGLKDNAVRALRSSASTGNLKAAAASGSNGNNGNGVAQPLLGTVNEGATILRNNGHTNTDAKSSTSSKGRRSLDIVRNTQQPQQQQQSKHLPPLLLRGLTQTPSAKSQSQFGNSPSLNSSYVQIDAGSHLNTSSIYSQNSVATQDASGVGSLGDSLNTGISTSLSAMPMPATSLYSRSRTKSRSRSRNSIIITNNASVEESLLNSLIKESRVTLDDNAMRWNWDVIRSIILGPMSQSRRLPEEVSISGFLTRLSRFFHPASLEFCDLSRTTGNEEYLEIGRHLIHILISSADGLLLIDESRLLPGIVDEVLKQNSYARRKSREESCFSFARLQMTMSPGYFHFLSEIDSSIGGDSLLERARLFDAYYQVVELSDQVLLIQYILASMSYASEGHARNILRKVASSSQESLRLLVPSFLLYLASDSLCRPGSISAWAIEVLLDLIYDSSPVVRSAAAQCLVLVIDLAAENPQLGKGESEARIAYLLELQPMFDLAVVTDIRPLVLRIIATESGYTYLKEQGIVDSEMEAWGALEGIFYVQSIELDVARALAYGPLFSSSSDGSMMMTTSSQTPSTPAHLFGELTKSTGGREFLQEFGIPRLLFETLANIPWDSALPTDITGLKATLWAIGAIGASRDGYLMLQSYNVIDKIIEVMHQTTSLSLKGTCLYALALISRNMFAAEVFREKGWLLCSSCYGNYEFAVPKRLETVFNADGWASKGLLDGSSVLSEESMKEPDVTEDLDSVQKEIIEAVIRMSNHVMLNTASKTLMRLRTSHPHYFRLMPLYCKAIHLLGKYRYRLSTRRFIYDVFDVNLASLHEEMIEAAVAAAMSDQEHEHEMSQQMRGALSADAGGVSRRFSSSSQHFLQTDSATQRKRASTLQGLTSSVFSRRLTNGLIDDIRPARTGPQTAGAGTTRMPPTPATPNSTSGNNMVV
ncbi:hypothetical protein H4S08_000493 [Coemansia sp. RSA 1365]|nr:hypothetical protein H4S08_000493 [Coemansia sp. RSA 1365]